MDLANLFSTIDLVALCWFVAAWVGYAILVDFTSYGRGSLNARMNAYRDWWMKEMMARDVRIVDTQINASLQNGTAFFASTSLIAIGATLTLLRATEEIMSVVGSLPFVLPVSAALWELKLMGLTVVFAYAFFKFAWSYRLFNYVAILLGAAPPPEHNDTPVARAHMRRTALLTASAGRHFNRGQRALFFAVGYLGWFVSPWLLIVTTAAVLLVMWRRQFASDAHHAVASEM
jgi:uncharacterized membrane protein